jgi:2-desacetyl-2-hydroxyethyl bacteriochlorophyllide A dehydrogenase
MQALRFEGPQQLAVVDIPIPEPLHGQALVQVAATGICGSDLHGYMGRTGRRRSGMIMGHETVGRVVHSNGSAVGLVEGTVVAINPVISCGQCAACAAGHSNICLNRRLMGVDHDIVGGFAEFVVAPLENLVELPEDPGLHLGALVEPFAVGQHAVSHTDLAEGQSALVIGGGTIGMSCVASLRRRGVSQVLVSEPLAHRRRAAERMGATALDPGHEPIVERVSELTAGAGVDAVVDCVGTGESVSASLEACRQRGTVVVVGMERPTIEFPSYEMTTRERRLAGSFGYTAEEFVEIAQWIATSPPELEDYIEARVGFGELAERFHALATGEDVSLKVVLDTTCPA